jgi:hypothetical protein
MDINTAPPDLRRKARAAAEHLFRPGMDLYDMLELECQEVRRLIEEENKRLIAAPKSHREDPTGSILIESELVS